MNAEHPAEGIRLQKVLARAGVASRRAAEELIVAGRVTVNGERADLGRRIDPGNDRVEVDGVRVIADDTLVHYILNKPPGVVSTASDPEGRPTVLDLVPSEPRVFSVGRLDLDSEGLIILTNDGDLAHRLMHPSHGVEKEYLVEVDGIPSAATLRTWRSGVELDDGVTAPARAVLVDQRGDRAIVSMVLHEGRKRQVRRMCSALGHPVRRLVRVRIGPLRDSRLEPGQWRSLRTEEVRALDAATVGRTLGTRGRSATRGYR